MNLEDIQTTLAGLLNAITEFKENGVVVLVDDGTYPKTPGREEALNGTGADGTGKGLVLIVTPFKPGGLVDETDNGVASFDVLIHVIIEENVAVNRVEPGTLISAELALRLILNGVAGKPTVRKPAKPFLVDEPPFASFGTTNGTRQLVANFHTRCFVAPTAGA